MQALGIPLEQAPGLTGVTREVTVTGALPSHPDGRRLYDLWKEKAGFIVGEDIPSRRLSRLLPNLALCDYRASHEDFRIRVAGFALIRLFGKDIAQCNLREIVRDDEHPCLASVMMNVRDTGEPLVFDARFSSEERQLVHFETLLLRVLAADRKTPLVLAGLFFFNPPRAQAAE